MESSIGIKLKTVPRSLIHQSKLREKQKFGNNGGSAIVTTVVNHSEALYLYAKSLRFEKGLKVVEKF